MKYLRILCSASLLTLFLFPAPPPDCCAGTIHAGPEGDYPATIQQTRALIEKMMEEDRATGVSIALVDGQKTVWSEGFGFADKEKGIKATPDTIYEIGSISKTITATAIMRLQDQGLIDIDRPLSEYIPEFSILPPPGFPPQQKNQITLRSMLTHHSGLPGDLQNGAFTLNPRTDYNARVLDYLKRGYACYPPGFIWAYSNTAYSLLGEVIARVSGRSFEEFTDGLFERIGMHQSSYFLNKPGMKDRMACAYLRGEPLEHFHDNMWAAGSVRSNVSDMALFIGMILGRGRINDTEILKPETLDEMLTVQNENMPFDLDFRQGLAWVLMDRTMDGAGRVCSHTGSTNGFFGHIEILPDHQLGVVALANTEKAVLALKAARTALKLALKEKAGVEIKEPRWADPASCTTRLAEKPAPPAGMYATEGGYDIITAVPEGLKWWSSFLDKTQMLIPLENGLFASPDSRDLLVEFTTISGRDVMIFHGDVLLGMVGRSLWGEKFEPAPVPPSWAGRTGTYEISNLHPDDCSRYLPAEIKPVSHSVELAVKDGLLLLGFTIQANSALLVLEPVSDTVARIRGLGRNRGGAVQIEATGGREEIELWGSLYRKR